MAIGFLRPVGASSDVKELEYVSAIHQTDLKGVRADGSIRDEDIVHFLLSRYGVDISEEEVRAQVMQGLGGGNGCIDLMEMMCMLMIPTLLKAASPEELPEDMVRPRNGLIDYVLHMILHDTTGSQEPKTLDKRLIQRILVSYGELDLATDITLIEEMLAAAQTDDGKLNLEAFSKGLTHDVQLYDFRNETRLSTNYDDVFLTKNQRDDWDDGDEVARKIAEERKSMSKALNRRFTAPALDMVAETYRSKLIIVGLWVTFMVTQFGYEGYSVVEGVQTCPQDKRGFEYGKTWSEQSDAMACQVGKSVAEWLLTFLWVSLLSFFFIALGSCGNAITCKRFYLPIIGIVVIVIYTVFPWMNSLAEGTTYLKTVSFGLGIFTCIIHLDHILILLVPERRLQRMKQNPLYGRIFESGVIVAETNIKRAAAHKVNVMIKHALELAQEKDREAVMETHFGQSLLAFARTGDKFKEAGGFIWTWKRIFSGEAFREEGLWLSSRLLASNMAQFLVSVFVLIAGIRLSKRVSEQYDVEAAKRQAGEYLDLLFNRSVPPELVEELAANYSLLLADYLGKSGYNETCANGNFTDVSQAGCELVGSYFHCDPDANDDYICTLLGYANESDADGLVALGLLNASGFDADYLLQVSQDALVAAAEASVDSIYPSEKYMVTVPCAIGCAVAFITAVSLAVTYIPSVTSTTLKLRSGVISTLKDRDFNRYRFATDQVTILTGSMFWGCLFASFLVGGVVGSIVFLFLWQATVAFVQKFVAIVIGILAVVVIKMIFLMTCRAKMYKAFYRKKPAAANLTSLALECTNFVLSVGFIFLRMCKLLITAALYVGRIDTPFLAPGVGRLGDLELDGYPVIFVKDILSHEAHRHPYLELMGVMYLMKLRYGEHFGNRAGSTWRLIFVYALMPWLNKYRILREGKAEDEVTEDTVRFFGLRDMYQLYRGDNYKEQEEPGAPSSLMAQFKNLRSSYRDELSANTPLPANLMRRSVTRASKRSTLLLRELESEHVEELEKEKLDLEIALVGLQGENEDLQEEIQKLTSLLQKKVDIESDGTHEWHA